MKKLLFIPMLLLFVAFTPGTGENVYICDNGITEVYHLNKDCSALRKCNHGVKPLSLLEAKKANLRLCGLED